MAKRESAAARSRRAVPDHVKEQGRKNLAAGRAKKQQETKAAHEAGLPKAGERWAALLDGTLTVRDLDDTEIKKMRPRGADGGFAGSKRRLPSHLAQQFHQEAIRRANDRIRTAAPEAVKELLKIGTDPDVKDSDRLKALMYVIDRGLGKTPETIRIEAEDRFERLLGEVAVDRDLDDEFGEAIQRDGQA